MLIVECVVQKYVCCTSLYLKLFFISSLFWIAFSSEHKTDDLLLSSGWLTLMVKGMIINTSFNNMFEYRYFALF